MRTRRLLDWLFIAFALVAGAWLRLRGLGTPSLWLDEIINVEVLDRALHLPLWKWLIGFEAENGPLYYVTELAGRFLPTPELAMRFAPALFGIATILVAWFCDASARMQHSPRNIHHSPFAIQHSASQAPSPIGETKDPATPPSGWTSSIRYVFPLLLAAAPLHVYYSREGRPYALEMLLATALLAAMLRGARPRIVAPLLAATAWTAASTVPLLGAALVAALFAYRGRTRWLVAGSAAASIALVPLLYRGGVNHAADYGFPALTLRSLRAILESFSAAALDTAHMHRVAFVFLVLAILGAIRLPQRGVVLSFAILPAAGALLALWRLDHFFAIRYLSPALPGYLLLVAGGVAALASYARKAAPAVAIVAALLLVRDGLAAARQEPFAKLDWRGIARTIGAHSRPGDQVIATNDWTRISLGFYLREEQVDVRLLDASASREMALMFLAQHPQGWIAAAGLPDPPPLHDLACEYLVVRGERHEDFRLHYVPSLAHFVAFRSTPGQRRALLASYGGTLDLTFGPSDAPLLDTRWHDGAMQGDAGIALPLDTPADRQLVLDVEPTTPQPLTVYLNDRFLAAVNLGNGRNVYRIDAPRGAWNHGANRLIVSAAAVRFHRFAVLASGQLLPPIPPAALHRIHLGDVGRSGDALPLPRDPDPAKLAALSARLGFDPQTTVPKFLHDEIRPADLAVTLADDSACMDDETFLRMTWRALFQREIDSRELEEWLRKLRAGKSREDVARKLADSLVAEH